MSTNECKAVRRQIDETGPDGALNLDAAAHLGSCAQCRTFRSERRALRGLLAGLGPVEAPSDFYFRLRGRLARNEKLSGAGNWGNGHFSMAGRALAAVALVAVLAVVGMVVKNWRDTPAAVVTPHPDSLSVTGTGPSQVAKAAQANQEAGVSVITPQRERSGDKVGRASQLTPVPRKNITPRNNSTAPRRIEAVGVREFAVSPAAVLTRDQSARDIETGSGSVVLVPLDARALKISIDNGRGTSRTISLPTVSFGSQRLVARESFLLPVSPAKGVW